MALTTTNWVLQDLNLTSRVVQGSPAPGLRTWESYDQLRQEVEAAIKTYVKWEIEQVAGQIDYYDGSGQPELVLRRPFVRSITNVWVDPLGAYGNNATGFDDDPLTNGTDYSLKVDADTGGKSGLLIRLRGSAYWMPSDFFGGGLGGWPAQSGLSYVLKPAWPNGAGNIKVTYTYGFTTAEMPLDIKLAVSTAVSVISNTVKYGAMVQSESLARYSYSLAISTEAAFGTVRQLLSRYRDTST